MNSTCEIGCEVVKRENWMDRTEIDGNFDSNDDIYFCMTNS